jgi:predicted DNA-binding protein
MAGIAPRKMHQTTVRFGSELWETLERECEKLGVSAAQYIREAALTRLVYAAGRRGDDDFELALELVTGTGTERKVERLPANLETPVPPARAARDARDRAEFEAPESAAG